MADGSTQVQIRTAGEVNAPTLYAEKGALISPGYREHCTKLYADPARTRWVMVVKRPLSEGEVVEGHFPNWHPITWGSEAQQQQRPEAVEISRKDAA